MGQVMTDGLPNYGVFGFQPGDAVLQTRPCQAQEGLDSQRDMLLLSHRPSKWAAPDARARFQALVVHLICQACRAYSVVSSMLMSRRRVAQYSSRPSGVTVLNTFTHP